jgi:S1-C subfamily serine protease
MKVLRPILWAAALAAGFIYFTSGTRWDIGRLLRPLASSGPLWTEPASAATAYTADEQNNIDIYRTAREATVNISSVVWQQDWFYRYPVKGAGSGFIVKSTGEILTNNHVVTGAQELTVTLEDKKVYKAKLLGMDPRSDLALIKIDAGRKLPTLPLGNSETLIVGQKVLAIGNPFGQFGGTLTTGVVSSLDRTIETEEGRPLEGMVQTDAAINPGNSGGPLLDSHGSVIGINTAIYGPQGNIGIGFAMPVNRAKAMLEEFESTGRISRPALGIRVLYVSDDLAEALRLPREGGLLIQSVEEGSAAEAAGLRGANRTVVVNGRYQIPVGGDLIVAIEGKLVESRDSLERALNRKRGGDMLSLSVLRNGRTVKVDVKLGEAPRQL